MSTTSWVALPGLDTAWPRSGGPGHGLADRGGACLADALAGGGTRRAMAPQTLSSTAGPSAQNLLATHGHLQRRVEDYQGAVPRTPREFAEAHQRVLDRYTPPPPQASSRSA